MFVYVFTIIVGLKNSLHFSEIDECTMLTDKCDENAICTDTPDSYECTCKEGYIGNGTTCEG